MSAMGTVVDTRPTPGIPRPYEFPRVGRVVLPNGVVLRKRAALLCAGSQQIIGFFGVFFDALPKVVHDAEDFFGACMAAVGE